MLTNLPVHPPTGGWAVLNDQAGIGVSLPATVEEYLLEQGAGAHGGFDQSVGDRRGRGILSRRVVVVSAVYARRRLRPGERLVFYFPAGRLRSEVYVNGKLAGYSIISEAPFTADATDAIKPGETNLLAVRITNPGGRLDWMDFLTMTWGEYTLPATHALGGLAGGVEMQVRAPVSVSDLAVFNKPDPPLGSPAGRNLLHGPGLRRARPLFHRPGWRRCLQRKPIRFMLCPARTITTSIDATVGNAQFWDIDQPNLYQASATLPAVPHSDRTTTFGFRWLEVRGLGTDAKLYLNGRRIVPRSSISWGFWAPNGMFPDENAAGREIAAMKALGLDTLQNHRHMPKSVVLDAFDRVGFMRYCEAGGGVLTFESAPKESAGTRVQVEWKGKAVELDFLNRYQLAKQLAMIRAFRSHPCVSLWTLQNETSPDVNNPRMRYALEKMRQADPSRMVLLKSGIGVENQVWCLPYADTWRVDDGTGRSGWWDQHTAMDSPGVWIDALYKSPVDFKYRTDNRKEIVAWGEMATGASPDDHAADVHWYKTNRRTGYDLAAHQAILAAYETFLDDHQFRPAFSTAAALFQQAGAKHYFSAARLLENARICDAVDYVVLSGWESTTIDNHSGLVDALRQLKADPASIRRASQPEVLVVRPRRYVIARGDTAVVDVHQVNEQNLTGSWHLKVTASLAGRAPLLQEEYPVELLGGETFGQLLKQNIAFKADQPGLVMIRAALSSRSGGPPVLEREEPLLVIDPQPAPLNGTIACGGESEELIAALKRQFNANAVAFSTNLGNAPTILLTTAGGGLDGWQSSFTDASVANTDDPELYKHQMWGQPGLIHAWRGLASGKITVKLHLDDGYSAVPGQRLFDIAINGTTVAKDFDIFASAGGKDRALVKSFVVDAPEGTIRLSVPRVASDNATFAAVELRDSSGRVVRAVFRDTPYTDPAGNVWSPITRQADDYWMPDLRAAVERARLEGTRVVLLTSGGSDAERVAAYLADQGLVTYSGPVGPSGPSWMGFWFFGRQHALLAGLPSDCVLDWPYQITTGNGLMLSGSGLETVVGYGKNHDPNVGVAAAVVPCGRGKLVLLALPGLMDAFINSASGRFQPVTAKRLMFNALNL